MRKLLLASILLLSLSSLKSQEFLGIRQSNYSGVLGLDYNPSSIADNRMKVDVVLFGAFIHGYNNHAYFNPKYMPYGWINSFNYNDEKARLWMDNKDLQKFVSADSISNYPNAQIYEFDDGRKTRSAFLQAEIDVLNVMISFNHKRSIGFQIKNRTMFNLDNVTPELIRLASNEWDYMRLFNLNLKDQNLNLSMNTWNEYNFAYAQVLKDDNQHFWKMGAKLKFLQGIGSFYINTDNVDYNIIDDTTALYIK